MNFKSSLKYLVSYLLEKESVAILKKYKPKIVAITGTVGKTSTRDAVFAALSQFVHARKSPKNFNTDIGVPLTIIGRGNPGADLLGWLNVLLEGLILIILPNHYPEWLVLEVGTDRPGDIADLARWLKPDIVIITKLSKVPVHVEAFKNPEELFNEKGNLVRALKEGGTLILNADDEDVMEYRTFTDENIVLFGSTEESDISASHYEIVYDEGGKPTGICFDVSVKGEVYAVRLPDTLGEQHMSHVLAAMAVCKLLGESLAVAAKSFHKEEPTPGRMRLIPGKNGATIIDDTYNSSPAALEEALNTLEQVKGKRKIAIIGDMLELGKYSSEEHRKAGERAGEIADIFATVGVRAKHMGAREELQFNNSTEAAEFMKGEVREGDVVLVKGSQGVRVEKVVEALMAEPEKKKKLLVRQDEEWEKR
ncbi:UDP-N-acetylmuramoyl-tripeptide--D-alanyl-D-alanine ligase [Candidatus Parcubacteria bacterium]|nr:UDP-N-acetylmuramoyl-tripeptide--D-alanyl-D-alanine ligase [Candidatus Parcubacteria bacterium]